MQVVCPRGESGCQVDSAWVTGGCTVQVVCPRGESGCQVDSAWVTGGCTVQMVCPRGCHEVNHTGPWCDYIACG